MLRCKDLAKDGQRDIVQPPVDLDMKVGCREIPGVELRESISQRYLRRLEIEKPPD